MLRIRQLNKEKRYFNMSYEDQKKVVLAMEPHRLTVSLLSPTPSDAPDARPSRGVSALASLQYCHKKSTIGLNILKICLTEPKSRGVDLFPYARVIKLAAWTPQVFNLKNYFAAVAKLMQRRHGFCCDIEKRVGSTV